MWLKTGNILICVLKEGKSYYKQIFTVLLTMGIPFMCVNKKPCILPTFRD